jgi:hypothetical protein
MIPAKSSPNTTGIFSLWKISANTLALNSKTESEIMTWINTDSAAIAYIQKILI